MKKLNFFAILLLLTLFNAHNLYAADSEDVDKLCQSVAKKLRTVKLDTCLAMQWQDSGYKTSEERPLVYREVTPIDTQQPPEGRILFIGGIHGDEYAAISLTYLWLDALLKARTSPVASHYQWLFLPVANPDGLLHQPAQRQNGRGVDLNRNFNTPDWNALALHNWKTIYHQNPRRYPGPYPASEIETQWIQQIIDRFQPDAIISVHAPYGLLDYDGPEHAQPNKIGHLKLRPLGTYPGSLGRYAGENLKIPVLTVELTKAGRLPNRKEIQQMWQDLEHWIGDKIEHREIDF